MTAKELLRERIEALTEEEAADALELLDTEVWPDFPAGPTGGGGSSKTNAG